MNGLFPIIRRVTRPVRYRVQYRGLREKKWENETRIYSSDEFAALEQSVAKIREVLRHTEVRIVSSVCDPEAFQ